MLRAGPDHLNPTPERVSQSALTGFLAWVPGRCQTEDSMLFRLQARHGYVRNVNRGGWVGGEREFGLRSRGARRTQVQLLWSGGSVVIGRFWHGNSRVREVFCTPVENSSRWHSTHRKCATKTAWSLTLEPFICHVNLFLFFFNLKNVIQRFGTLVPSVRRVRCA